MNKNQPLADKLRPQTLDDIVGQDELLMPNGLLHRMVQNKKLVSLILYGPPGTGKTSLATALCNDLKVPHDVFNASIDDKAKLTGIIKLAKMSNNGYVIVLEEIHRLNRDKQDILLPYLEKGVVTLIGCTTENPYFIVNPAIRSRCQILELKPLTSDDIYHHLQKLIVAKKIDVKLTDKQLELIAGATNGDYRSVINIIDMIQSLYHDESISDDVLSQFVNGKYLVSSHYGDAYYDLLSAFHKSLRGSDPDAVVYYLARLIEAKDFVSLNRRLIACAYEDIGLANPQLCARVVTAVEAANIVGYPECKQIYSDIAIEMAMSPKSNSGYLAYMAAKKDITHGKMYPIPMHLRDNNYKSHVKLGRVGYIYPHDYGGYVNQEYLPKELKGTKYYHPNPNGLEPKLGAWLEAKKKEQGQ